MSKADKRRNPGAALCSILGTVLLILVILICIPVTIPNFMGYHVYNVISGSMEPNIPVGSLIYVEDVDPTEVEVGDVIAFYGNQDGSGIITHRVVENYVTGGEFTTKGDANETEDVTPVPYINVIGRVVKSIPKLGMIAAVFDTVMGKIYALCGIAAAIILISLGSTLKDKQEKRQRVELDQSDRE